ncbi:MAG TPA: hypothetical protein VFQ61_03265 [Polyangiaceae bacterium]|nr:hypothetical protein [Polyangiaceae bacterium]
MTPPSLRKPVVAARRVLRSETQGDILILGIILGGILASAIYAFVGLSSTLAAREASQNAADAAAFENAIWHARSMNLMASLNVLMVASVATLALWRLAVSAVAFAGLTNLVVGMSEPSTAQQDEAVAIAEPLAEMLAADEGVAARVASIVTSLNAAQVAVAAYAPVWALQGADSGTKRNLAHVAASASLSLLPNQSESVEHDLKACLATREVALKTAGGSAERAVRSALRDAKQSTLTVQQAASAVAGFRASTTRLGAPFSLPAQRDAYSVFCSTPDADWHDSSRRLLGALTSVARAAVIDLPLGAKQQALQRLGVEGHERDALARISEVSGFEAGRVSGALCSPSGPAVEVWTEAAWRILARTVGHPRTPAAVREKARKLYAESHFQPDLPPSDLLSLNPIDNLDRARAVWARWSETLESSSGEFECGRPAKVWNPAHNGSPYFLSTTLTPASESLESASPSGPSVLTEGFWAHAEMYFDCVDQEWSRCAPNALWQPLWRARLRRVQSLSDMKVRDETGHTVSPAFPPEAVMIAGLRRVASTGGLHPSGPPAPLKAFLPFPERQRVERDDALVADRNGAEGSTPLRRYLAEHAGENRMIH